MNKFVLYLALTIIVSGAVMVAAGVAFAKLIEMFLHWLAAAVRQFFRREPQDFRCDTCDSPICDGCAIYEKEDDDGMYRT